MPVPELPLDLSEFVVVPNVFVLDEFDMTDDDGQVIARIDAKFIEKLVARMQERERDTGDLCPIVIGHTKDNPQGGDEVNGPPLIGYFVNWKQIPFFDTGKTGAAPDALIYRRDVERAKKFPRRSSEVWLSKHEIDPVSFLGATTPARDLGMLKLNRGGSLTYTIGVGGCIFDCPVRLDRSPSPTNRESDMADENKKPTEEKRDDKPPADPGQSGSMKEVIGMIQNLTSIVQSLAEKIGGAGGATPPAGAAGAVPTPSGAEGAEGGEDAELTDEELSKYMAQLGGDGGEEEGAEVGVEGEEDEDKSKSRKGEKPVQNSASQPGGDNTFIANADVKKKLQRTEEEISVLRAKLARNEIKERLRVAVEKDGADIDPTDEKLITDLVVMPSDMAENMIVRLSRIKSKTTRSGHIESALQTGQSGGKKVRTEDDKKAVIKLARAKGIKYEVAAAELGYDIG